FEAAGTLQLVTLLWAAGALLMLLRFGIGTILVARETRLARRPVSREWVVLAGQIQEEMDLNRQAMLRWGTKREVPYTWGLISPAVCLPADADKWSLERLRIVMIHELAHVQRLDTVGELVAQVALVIFWFNPLLWLAVASVRPAAAGPALPQVAGAPQETAGVHVRAQRQDYSDFDELVADCRRKKPKLGVRYCEVRTVDLSGATGQMEFDGGRLGGA